MRLYSLNKRQFVLVFVTFLASVLVSVMAGTAGPHMVDSTMVNGSMLLKPAENHHSGPYILHSPPVSTFHQQLWLIASIHIEGLTGSKFEQDFLLNTLIRGANGDAQSTQESSNPLLSTESHNRTRRLTCTQNKCDDLVVMHLGYLDFPYYIVTVQFYNLDKRLAVTGVLFTFKSYNPAFTQIEIWVRFVFLVLSFLITCWYAHCLRKFSLRDWSVEQKWLSVLLPLLLFFNDPIFPLSFLMNSWLPGVLDGLFQATFLCALLLFWLCIYHSVRQTDRRFSVFYLPKLILVTLIWFCALTLACWHSYTELRDPTYFYSLESSGWQAFKIMFFVFGGLYTLYLLYLMVRAYAELRLMPYFDLRLKFMTGLMVIVVSVSLAITALRFTSAGPRAAGGLGPGLSGSGHGSATQFVALYSLLNFYLFTMAFVYSPSPNALFETHFQDNPALSMLNDSDEDVHYSSDTEDAVLTRPRARLDSEEETFH